VRTPSRAQGDPRAIRVKGTVEAADDEDVEHQELLLALVEAEASDIHCKPGSVPVLRVGGELVRRGEEPLTVQDVAEIAQAMFTSDAQNELIRTGSTMAAYSEPGLGRFRVTGYRQRGSLAIVIHAVADDVPRLDRLGLPDAAGSLALADRGLLLVSSPVGNGATTTLAALVDHVNSNRRRHVVTVEHPIEVLHTDDVGMVSQLEVGADVPDAAEGIRTASRLDADVVVVSDIGDRETAAAVLDGVARGRLVIGAIGGHSVVTAVHAFLELFTVEEREIARSGLARGVAGILAQRLLPAVDGTQVAAVESLVHTSKVEHCLADPDRVGELRGLLEDGEYHGMQTMDQSLVALVRAGRIDADTALAMAADPEDLRIELLR
jgi:twitching motility protein PilT